MFSSSMLKLFLHNLLSVFGGKMLAILQLNHKTLLSSSSSVSVQLLERECRRRRVKVACCLSEDHITQRENNMVSDTNGLLSLSLRERSFYVMLVPPRHSAPEINPLMAPCCLPNHPPAAPSLGSDVLFHPLPKTRKNIKVILSFYLLNNY